MSRILVRVTSLAVVLAVAVGLTGCAAPRDAFDSDTWTLTTELRDIDGVVDAEATGAYEGNWPIWVQVRIEDKLDRDALVDTVAAIHKVVNAADRFGDKFGRYELTVAAFDPEHPSGVWISWSRGLPPTTAAIRSDSDLWLDLIEQAPVVSLSFDAFGTFGRVSALPEVAADGSVADATTLEPLYRAVWANAGLDPSDLQVEVRDE